MPLSFILKMETLLAQNRDKNHCAFFTDTITLKQKL